MSVIIKDMEQEFLDSIKDFSAETQEICKAVRQQTLGTIKNIQADFDLKKSDIDSRIEALKQEHEANKQATTIIEDLLAKHGKTLKGIKESSNITKESYNSMNGLISKAIEDHKENLQRVLETKNGDTKDMVIKTNYLRTSVTSSTQAIRLGDYGLIGYKNAVAYDLFPKVTVGPESNGTIRYIDQTTATRNAAGVSEAGTFPESAVVWTEYTLTLEKIGDTIPISEEAVKDTARLAGEVERFLALNIDLKVNTDLTVGSGTTPTIKGVYTYAPTYTAAASGITSASAYDLLVKMRETIMSSYNGKYRPNFAMMSTVEINKMKLRKDTHNNYVQPPFANGVMEVDGLMIVENNDMAVNTVVIGDSRFGTIYELEGYSIGVGYSGTQYAADMMTLKARRRLALLIRTADQTGFLKCTSISGALTTLAT
jgi:HK97 family phage major capsid protein